MKRRYSVGFAVLTIIALYFGGYVVLIERNGVSKLGEDPFVQTPAQRLVNSIYSPLKTAHDEVTTRRCIMPKVTGIWINSEAGDSVSISEDGRCKFRLGSYSGFETGAIDASVGSFRIYFTHNGSEYLIDIGPTEPSPNPGIVAIVQALGRLNETIDVYSSELKPGHNKSAMDKPDPATS